MGEAKIKEDKRRQQATKIVNAFETFICALIVDLSSSHVEDRITLNNRRDELIDALVEPPPK